MNTRILAMDAQHLNKLVSLTAEFEKKEKPWHSKFAEEKHSFKNSMSIDNGVLRLHVVGALVIAPEWWMAYSDYSYTAYSDINEFIAYAESEGYEKAELVFNSGGGVCCNEFLLACDAIFSTSVEITAVVDSICASAAYALASQCDRIQMVGKWSNVGSIGVLQGMYYSNDYYMLVTNEESDLKVLNADDEEHVAALRKELDSYFDDFKAIIDRKRKISDHGRGAVFKSEAAMEMNLVDGYYEDDDEQNEIITMLDQNNQEKESLEASTSKDSVPLALINAHIKLAAESGAWEVAAKAIQNGEEPENTLVAHLNYAKKTAEIPQESSKKSVKEVLAVKEDETKEVEELEESPKEQEEKSAESQDPFDRVAAKLRREEH